MSNDKWTKEPWEKTLANDGIAEASKAGGIRPIIATVYNEDDRSRIITCVNALAGISNEALESGVVEEMVEALKMFTSSVKEERKDAYWDKIADSYRLAKQSLAKLEEKEKCFVCGKENVQLIISEVGELVCERCI